MQIHPSGVEIGVDPDFPPILLELFPSDLPL